MKTVASLALVFFLLHTGSLAAQDADCLAIEFDHAIIANNRPSEVVNRFLELGEAKDDDDIRARGLLRLAFLRVGENADFLGPLERGLDLAMQGGRLAQVDAYLYGGYIKARGLKDLEGGITDVRSAIDLSREMAYDRPLVFANIVLAEMLTFNGGYEEGRQALFRAAEFADALNDQPLQGLIASRILSLLGAIGSFETAVPFALQKIESIKGTGRSSGIAEWILWRAGELPDYETRLRERLGLLPPNHTQSKLNGSTQRRELTRLAFVIVDSSPQEANEYAKTAAELHSSNGHLDLAGWSEIIALMAQSNFEDRNHDTEFKTEFDAIINTYPSVFAAINAGCHNQSVASFLRTIGDENGATEFHQREIERLRTIADHATASSKISAKAFFTNEVLSRQKNHEIESQRTKLSLQRGAAETERQRYLLTRNVFIVCLCCLGLMVLGARHFLLQRHRNRLQVEVREKTESLEQSIQQAERARDLATKAGNAKSDFYAQLNHEIRNPLQAIIGLAEALQMPKRGSRDDDAILDGIRGSGEHLLRLINNALDMSSIESGKVELIESMFDFPKMIDEIDPVLSELAENKSLAFNCKISADVPRYVVGDEIRIRQVLLNLGMNAIKFTNSGSVDLLIEAEPCGPNHTEIKSLVRDTGCGIPSEDIESIFEPFSQSTSAKVTRDGTGLGLYICKSYTDLMGGELQVESELGKGSTFSFTLQMRSCDSLAPSESSPRKVNRIADDVTVLVVDDNQMVRESMQGLLRVLGVRAEIADGLESAQQIIEQVTPSIIFLDIHMPDKNGYEVAASIRTIEFETRPTIIALTGDVVPKVRERALAAGFDDMIAKPVSSREIQSVLEQWLARDPVSAV